MSDSKCSVVVCDLRALAGRVDEPVVPDPGGEGEQALSDPDGDTGRRSAAVLFEAELTLEGVVDRLDTLTNPAQRPAAPGLVPPIWPNQCGSQFPHEVLELTA